MRPFRGQREIFRRLEERNEAHLQRINNVRQLGGLEPIEQPEIPNNFTVNLPNYHEPIIRWGMRTARPTYQELNGIRGTGARFHAVVDEAMEDTRAAMHEALEEHFRRMREEADVFRAGANYGYAINPCAEISFSDSTWVPFRSTQSNENCLGVLNKDWNNKGEFLEKDKYTFYGLDHS